MATSSSTSRYYRRRYTKEEIARMTHCECNIPIYEQVSWTPENPGRRFKGCTIRNRDKKCEVYGFLDEELPSQYYKDLMFRLYKDNEFLESKLETLSNQDHAANAVGNKDISHLPNAQNGMKPTDVVTMEMLFKEMNELKVKAKVYDTFFMGSTCLIIVLLVLIGAVIVVSMNN